jgi:hypothetical protein
MKIRALNMGDPVIAATIVALMALAVMASTKRILTITISWTPFFCDREVRRRVQGF